MSIQFNHTIVWCRDKQASSQFLTETLGLPPARPFLHFMVVQLSNGVSMDFMEKTGEVSPQHYAFQVAEHEFEDVLARLRSRSQPIWADPARTLGGQLNHRFNGRGFYFDDPNGHLLECLTAAPEISPPEEARP
ncbi:VOC family protein [Sphingomonas asaccharolytica]|uniref:VOC family protein n=1 Tax=Sphingomonas asaccharolytica TaxID=40681 RepID=UPI000830BBFD|nr:VOC family protein [Sphingomonas asaccharolytica]